MLDNIFILCSILLVLSFLFALSSLIALVFKIIFERVGEKRNKLYFMRDLK